MGLVLLPVLLFLINKYTSIENPLDVKFLVLMGVIALFLYGGCEIAATTETFHWLNDGLGIWKCDGVPQGISSDKWFDC